MNDLVNFFKAPIFSKIAQVLWQRYIKQGDFGKSLDLSQFDKLDLDPLRQWLGLSVDQWSKLKTLSLAMVEQTLLSSAVSWTLKTFVQQLMQENHHLKLEDGQKTPLTYATFLKQLDTIDPIFTQKLTSAQLKNWFQKADFDLRTFNVVAKALKNLPTAYTRLSAFAEALTGDAYIFNDTRPAGQVLLAVLTVTHPVARPEMLTQAEKNATLLAQVKLLRDDIDQPVRIRGLKAQKHGVSETIWAQECLDDRSWQVPLKTILQLDKVYPDQGQAVLIVGDAKVYSILLDQLPTVPMVCSEGPLTYAVWQLLAKLTTQTQVYYVADIDPVGLNMAQRLLTRLPRHSHTIGMTMANYQAKKQSADLSRDDLKQLRGIRTPGLSILADDIMRTNKVAYQKSFVAALIQAVQQTFAVAD